MNLDEYLENKGLKKKRFSEMIGISRESLYLYMSGRQKIPLYIRLAIERLTDGKVTEIYSGRGADTASKSKKS